MDYKDLLITPIYLCIFFLILYIRQRRQPKLIRKYYLKAFGVKVVGAISVGVLFYFYYGGGDTTIFFRDQSVIFEAFWDSPEAWFKLVTYQKDDPVVAPYIYRIYYFIDSHSRPIIQIAGFISIFCFNTYSIVAIIFALYCFGGLWRGYEVFVDLFPELHRSLAFSFFFVPSVFVWGSGLLKDTITLGALGFALSGFYYAFVKRQKVLSNIVILLVAAYVIQLIKMYILLTFLPPMFLWLFLQYRSHIKSKALRAMVLPILLILAVPLSLFAVSKLTEGTAYSLEQIGETSKRTTEWLHYVDKRDGGQGSSYYLGELDGSVQSMLALSGPAVIVSLFRPWLWEVRNPIMLLEALQSLMMFVLTIKVLLESRFRIIGPMLKQPVILFCFVFVIAFAFGVGINSSNFGTLSRYRIPLIPFYMSSLYMLRYQVNKSTKLF